MLSLQIILMKHQRSNLNTLPPLLILCPWQLERTVRHASRPSIRLRIKTLDQRNQLRALSIPVIPLELRVWLHRTRLALAVGVDQLRRHEIAIRDGVRIRYSQGITFHSLDGPPHINNLVPAA